MTSTGFLLSILLCLALGSAIDTGSVCLVRAIKRLVDGKPGTTISFLVASCCAAIVLYVGTSLSMVNIMPQWGVPTLLTLLGAAIFAAGSIVNDACAVGTLMRVARGDIGHLATLAGGVAIALLLARPHLIELPPDSVGVWARGWMIGLLAVTVLVVLLWRRHLDRQETLSYAGLGAIAAALGAWRGDWTWLGVTEALQAGLTPKTEAGVFLVALLVGATATAMLRSHFHLRWPVPRLVAREFVGGALMAAGAILIPGGNDVLLVIGIPSGNPRALTAYAIMGVIMLGWFYVRRRLR